MSIVVLSHCQLNENLSSDHLSKLCITKENIGFNFEILNMAPDLFA